MEQGKLLPNFNRLKVLFDPLRILDRTSAASELTLAWLRTMAGEDDYRDVIMPLFSQGRPAEPSPIHKAMKRVLSDKKVHVSPAQLAAVYSDLDTYKCFLALSNDDACHSLETLARSVGLPVRTAERCLALLVAEKLVKKDRAGRYCSPLATALVEFPTSKNLDKELIARIKRFQEELLAGGTPVWLRRGVIRADARDLLNFLPIMALNLSTAHTYAVTKKTPHSALFAVEGRVVKLMDF